MSATAPPDAGWQTDWPTEPAGSGPPRRSPFAFLTELPAMVALFILIALVLKTFLLQLFFIPSESMDPTLHGCDPAAKALCGTGDRVVVNKLAYRFREPRRGEVIVFIAEKDERERSLPDKVFGLLVEGLGIQPPAERDFIKRVIALPGETIEVTAKAVYITPAKSKKRYKLNEPYANVEGGRNLSLQEPFRVPSDMYFVMGDNRNNSSDSRTSLGPIRRQDLIGKAFIRILPGKIPGRSPWERFRRLGLLEEGTYPPPLGTGAERTAAGAALVAIGGRVVGFRRCTDSRRPEGRVPRA